MKTVINFFNSPVALIYIGMASFALFLYHWGF